MLTQEDIEAFCEELEASRRPPLTVPQMVEIFAETMRQEKNIVLGATLIDEEYNEWKGVNFCGPLNKEGDIAELKELADLVYVIYGYARARGWDLDEAVRRVHKNNIDRCVWPDGSIKYRADGKALKNPNAPKIDLSDLV